MDFANAPKIRFGHEIPFTISPEKEDSLTLFPWWFEGFLRYWTPYYIYLAQKITTLWHSVALQSFQSYFSNRPQFVTINEENSCPKAIKYAVPNGSILFPVAHCFSLSTWMIYQTYLISTLAKFTLYASRQRHYNWPKWQCEEEIQLKLGQITSLLLSRVDFRSR